MASIYRRGRVWWVSFYANGRHRCQSLKTDSEKVARAYQKKFEYEIVTGALKIQGRVELEPVVRQYLDDVKTRCTPKTHMTAESFFRHFLPRTGYSLLNQLSPGALIDYFHGLREKGRAPRTMNRYREILHAFFQWAIRTGAWHLENPVAKVSRLRVPDPEILFLTLDQIEKQLRVLDRHPVIQAVVATLIYAGLRRDEALWLTTKDMDLQNGMIYVRTKTVGTEAWCSKTKKNRSVPISSDLLPILTRYSLARRRKYSRSDWFFPSPMGERWDADNFSTDLRKINRAAKLDWSSLHFRHTFGSQLAQKGVSLYKIAELMGNSPKIAQLHYAALVPDRMREDVEFARTREPREPRERERPHIGLEKGP